MESKRFFLAYIFICAIGSNLNSHCCHMIREWENHKDFPHLSGGMTLAHTRDFSEQHQPIINKKHPSNYKKNQHDSRPGMSKKELGHFFRSSTKSI